MKTAKDGINDLRDDGKLSKGIEEKRKNEQIREKT